MGYINKGQFIQIGSDEVPFDREFAHELANLFKQRTGLEFKQSRFILLSSQTQNDLVRDAGIRVQEKRKRRQQK